MSKAKSGKSEMKNYRFFHEMAKVMYCQKLRVAKVKCQILEWHKQSWQKLEWQKQSFPIPGDPETFPMAETTLPIYNSLPRTILELLVTSGISSGTPNDIRFAAY